MYDQVTLITISQHKNKNGEYIETETRLDVPIVKQKVTREQRDKYNERGAGRALRFKIQLFGPGTIRTTRRILSTRVLNTA